MSRKFDARLPTMTDEEPASVNESTLDKKSREELEIERRKRELSAKNVEGTTRSKWFWVKILFIVLGILVGALVMLIATAVRFRGMF